MFVLNLLFVSEKLINLIETELFNIWKQFDYVRVRKRLVFSGSSILLLTLWKIDRVLCSEITIVNPIKRTES